MINLLACALKFEVKVFVERQLLHHIQTKSHKSNLTQKTLI